MPEVLGDGAFWAAVRDWVIGLGTLGTLAVSLVVLKRQGDEIDSQAQERREAGEFSRSAQARQVKFSPFGGRGGGAGSYKVFMDYTPSFVVTNESDEAIHDVTVSVAIEGLVTPPPGGPTWVPAATGVLAAGEALSHRLIVHAVWDETSDDYHYFTAKPSVQFTDMSGQRWVRDHEHRLSKVSS